MGKRDRKESWLLGVGFDGTDGHKRMTKGKRFLVVGGSEETHERISDKVMRIDSKLKRKGKTIADLDPQDFIENYLEED